MAHIIAKSPNGPRGNSPLRAQDRDAYNNLILLCPNHHAEADRQSDTWPVEKLREIKASHEQWIQEQIDRGHLVIPVQKAEPFRTERIGYWAQRTEAWSFASVTPLELDEATVEVENLEMRSFLQGLRLPDGCSASTMTNPYYIETSANGLVTEDFSLLAQGQGYRIEIFRTGHVEVVICLNDLINRGTRILSSDERMAFASGLSDHRLERCEQLLPYFNYVKLVEFQVATLVRTWLELKLPFKNMVLTVAIIGMPRLCLLVSRNSDLETIFGRPVENRVVSHAVVAEEPVEAEPLLEVTLGRLVNAFGFVLRSFRDSNGGHATPERLSFLRSSCE